MVWARLALFGLQVAAEGSDEGALSKCRIRIAAEIVQLMAVTHQKTECHVSCSFSSVLRSLQVFVAKLLHLIFKNPVGKIAAKQMKQLHCDL